MIDNCSEETSDVLLLIPDTVRYSIRGGGGVAGSGGRGLAK